MRVSKSQKGGILFMGIFLLGCPTPVNIMGLAKGTTVLRGCKLKSVMCQVHTNQVLSTFRMLALITLPTSTPPAPIKS